MFAKLLKFFLENYRLNYTLFFTIIAFGVYSYSMLPKEVTPPIEPNSITIRGSYNGASLDTINSVIVEVIESEVKNIDGISSIESKISSNRYTITLELKKGAKKDKILKEIEDKIDNTLPNLPEDIKKPTIRGVAHSRALMQLSIFSSKYSKKELIKFAKELRLKILKLPYISDVTIFGDSNLFYEILIDNKKTQAYGISIKDVADSISNLSYIYPLGSIKNNKSDFFISFKNSNNFTKEFQNTVLEIDNKKIPLKSVATIKKRYEDSSTLASMNAKSAITLAISQNPKGDAIKISKDIKKLIKQFKTKDIEYDIKSDHSKIIKERIDIVVSNILFAIILITLLTALLINFRIAIVIALGIPTSFLIGAIYFYLTGYTININSLIGVLIAIGIIVDDAIVISENIQQYIQKGYSPKEAALLGTKEIAKPVTIASLTTIFAFIPLLMLSGRIGNILELIPIAISVLVLASLIESFLFLPIHSAHLLNSKQKSLSWSRVVTIYETLLNWLLKHRVAILIIFLIIAPLSSFKGLQMLKFKLFNRYDSNTISITLKAKNDTTLKETLNIIQTIEKDLLKSRDKFYIDYVSSTAGYRRSPLGGAQLYPYVGYITIYLQKRAPTNFLEKYITPYLSFYYDKRGRSRVLSSKEISKKIRKFLKQKGYKKRFKLDELNILQRRLGYVKADIMIGLIGKDYKQVLKASKELKKRLKSIKAVKFANDNIKFGASEIKLSINSYGKRVGLTQKYLSNYILSAYSNIKKGLALTPQGLLDLKVSSLYNNSIRELSNLDIELKDKTVVKLKDVCNFTIEKSLEKLTKDNLEVNFFVYANIDQSISSAGEVMNLIKPTLNRLKKEGLKINLKGEYRQKQILKKDMLKAVVVAIIAIFISMLYLFNSFKETLIVMSVIPLSLIGVIAGHLLMGIDLSVPSIVGALGLSGVIVNDGILMLSTIKGAKSLNELTLYAKRRFRAIILTTLTTVLGLSTLMFFASSQAIIFQPLAVSLSFGLIWGTILNLIYIPIIYSFKLKPYLK